jgi:malate/lactate dehydrogenase
MRVGIIGAGAVGAASLLSLVMRGPPACEIVVLDKNYARAKGVERICNMARRCHQQLSCALATIPTSPTPY